MIYYDILRKYCTLISCSVVAPLSLFLSAPFGRFTPQLTGSWLFNKFPCLTIDGRRSWVIMEITSPACFILTYLLSSPNRINPGLKPTLPPLLFLIHYLNRSIISPLVFTPSRSKTHIIVPFVGISFNITNGFLLGAYFTSEATHSYLIHQKSSPIFWLGVSLWFIGFMGNIFHDEILFRIRRKARSKGKHKEEDGEYYAIPVGGLYALVSYPNYLCEWLEWLGFAIASAPFPFPLDLSPVALFTSPPHLWLPSMTPPYIFLINLIFLMFPRAYRGHQWYRDRFKDSYPKERKAVIPFVF